MIFKTKDQLCIIEMSEENDNKITFDTLAKHLMDTPSNMIYCVKFQKLYGIISVGDIHRAKEKNKNSVDINTSFTFLNGHEYMKARKIFLENNKINALPIVDEEYKLIGDYSRWDDVFSDSSLSFIKNNKYAEIALKKYGKVAIIHPSKQIPLKMKMV